MSETLVLNASGSLAKRDDPGLRAEVAAEEPASPSSPVRKAYAALQEDGGPAGAPARPVTESVIALTGIVSVGRYRRHANFGCSCVGC